jgi:toxin ParE1/3/4
VEIRWSYEALEQLNVIEAFISKDSPERAARFVVQIIKHADGALIDQPRMGRIVPEISNADIRELIFKGYRIIYRLNPNCIEILTVFEGHKMLRIDEIGS